ncbi:molybdenum cofactor biosynthesis protein MoaE [Sinirhodobacter populi]|uniref:Molybdopterin synthase catalytic subunit n=1 Tax=Paenirhodobacter populi TaxID=2306993 RepID=A0A443KDR6_9RHOB|nr:molybdenum cofactor biosynthesis protein MoaE [Sinirhodobacter populi]RWR30938.1 molybdenum cofactor biosynthesis protein MoaE [Sinirhodobacter populi]
MRIAVQSAPFDSAAELTGFGGTGAGAIVTFTGIVRNDSGEMQALELEHYPGMTERAMTAIAEEAVARWSLTDVLVIHRYGRFAVGEQIMMVATAARHRKAAFEAAEFLMDYLKSRAPFWKKEIGPTGENWIAAKEADEDALKRW